jgi:hypothetical protein
MREDMDFMQPKGGFSAELSQSGKTSNPISLNQSRMNESGMLCCICFDNPPDAVFMDCGHGGVCYDCSLDIWKTTEECYLCRAVSFFGFKYWKKIVQVLQYDVATRKDDALRVITATQMVDDDDESEGRIGTDRFQGAD